MAAAAVAAAVAAQDSSNLFAGHNFYFARHHRTTKINKPTSNSWFSLDDGKASEEKKNKFRGWTVF